jgi:hypothetical protein
MLIKSSDHLPAAPSTKRFIPSPQITSTTEVNHGSAKDAARFHTARVTNGNYVWPTQFLVHVLKQPVAALTGIVSFIAVFRHITRELRRHDGTGTIFRRGAPGAG